jgi:hypothetical protein
MSKIVLMAAVGFVLSIPLALAYDQDTHYGLIYYLARQVGYVPANAQRIANASWSVDVNTDTQPVSDPFPVVNWVPGISPLATFLQAMARNPDQRKVLRSFHGFPDNVPPSCGNEDVIGNVDMLMRNGQVSRRLFDLLQFGQSQRNPGLYFHYLADVYSHAGFSCGMFGEGHAVKLHAPDFLGWKKKISHEFANAAVNDLTKFMSQTKLGSPCVANDEQVQQVVDRLIAVNPADTHTDTLTIALRSFLGDVFIGNGPDWDKAKPVFDAGLAKDQPVPEFHKIELKVRDVGTYLDAEPLYSGFALQTQTPSIFVLNEGWRMTQPSPTGIHFTVRAGDPNPDAIDLMTARHMWDFVAYNPNLKQWEFSRKPNPDEMPRAIPKSFGSNDPQDWEEAKRQVQDQLQLHLLLGLEEKTCKIEGSYFRGQWRFEKDMATGQIRAWVPAGREGWGPAVPVTLVRDFRDLAGH